MSLWWRIHGTTVDVLYLVHRVTMKYGERNAILIDGGGDEAVEFFFLRYSTMKYPMLRTYVVLVMNC